MSITLKQLNCISMCLGLVGTGINNKPNVIDSLPVRLILSHKFMCLTQVLFLCSLSSVSAAPLSTSPSRNESTEPSGTGWKHRWEGEQEQEVETSVLASLSQLCRNFSLAEKGSQQKR